MCELRYNRTFKPNKKNYYLLRPISKNFDEAGRHPFFGVIISIGSNAVAAYTGNNHSCLRHKHFTDNDRDQQTYGSDQSRPEQIPEMTGSRHIFFPPNVKTINAAVKTHTQRCLRS